MSASWSATGQIKSKLFWNTIHKMNLKKKNDFVFLFLFFVSVFCFCQLRQEQTDRVIYQVLFFISKLLDKKKMFIFHNALQSLNAKY